MNYSSMLQASATLPEVARTMGTYATGPRQEAVVPIYYGAPVAAWSAYAVHEIASPVELFVSATTVGQLAPAARRLLATERPAEWRSENVLYIAHSVLFQALPNRHIHIEGRDEHGAVVVTARAPPPTLKDVDHIFPTDEDKAAEQRGLEFLGAIRYRGDNLVLAFRFANQSEVSLSATVGTYKLPTHSPRNGRLAKEAQMQISKWEDEGIIANHFLVVPPIPAEHFSHRKSPVDIVAKGLDGRIIARMEIPTVEKMLSSRVARPNKVTKGLRMARQRSGSRESARSQPSPVAAQDIPLFAQALPHPAPPPPAPPIALDLWMPAVIGQATCEVFQPTQWTASLAALFPGQLHTYHFVRTEYADGTASVDLDLNEVPRHDSVAVSMTLNATGQFVVQRANALGLANLVNGPLQDHTGTFNLFGIVLLWDI